MWLNDAEHFLMKYLMWFIGGCLASVLSLFLANQLFISPPEFLTITFFLAPFAVAFLVQEISRHCMSTDFYACPRSYFSQALWYSLGFASIQFF